MRAIIQERYGAPEDVFALKEIDRPVPGDGQVLVRVHAVPVTGSDWHLFRGLPYAARPVTGMRRPRNRVPGLELAGTVEAVGGDVRELRPGDEVFGWYGGTLAEYVAVPRDQLVPKPANLTLVQAAAGPISAFTALQALRDRARIRPGQKVLISGASGGVGLYAVQLAKAYGAEVTGVCSTAKMDLVRSAGADHVIDYTREDFADGRVRYDAFLDVYGNPSMLRCRRALRPGGTLVFVGGSGGRWFMGTDRWLRGTLLAPFLRLKARVLVHKDSREDLVLLKELIESGKLTPVLDRTYPLSEVPEAIRYVREGRARGQVVIAVADPA
ncbi:NADPH:quinone reductase [Planobispora rosea]|uniref:NADPH:quinone reductase n=1 Tax=Planobispora rosea TaxID=35762 RepID=A0A8J3WCS2_PLARO|nr:NAD(P)-dependent alcohol dehydrogenase [Planobispora rosea]GGS69764.1 NADPH:quinone reductase [Planobispora rosea]GIH83176.1 NADPH:quinone reductase [Planobispora rosea]